VLLLIGAYFRWKDRFVDSVPPRGSTGGTGEARCLTGHEWLACFGLAALPPLVIETSRFLRTQA
jgi:hypothetical protein